MYQQHFSAAEDDCYPWAICVSWVLNSFQLQLIVHYDADYDAAL